MHAEWIKSPTARRVLVHWADARPAWLWSQDGETLLWRNDAARFFHGRIKKHGIKLAPGAVPIRGQIARLIRLGSTGRSSLSRIQFLAGDRPVSTTCTCTPLELEDGGIALLIVGVDPIEPELLEAMELGRADALSTRLFPAGAEYLLVSDDSQIAAGSPRALVHYGPVIESEGLPALPDGDSGEVEIGGERLTLTRFKASPQDAMLLLFEPANTVTDAAHHTDIGTVRDEEGLGEDLPRQTFAEMPVEPLLPIGLPPVEAEPVAKAPDNEHWVEQIVEAPPPPGTLSSLFDRLADDNGLYGALTERDETFAGPPPAVPDTVFVEGTGGPVEVAVADGTGAAPMEEPTRDIEPGAGAEEPTMAEPEVTDAPTLEAEPIVVEPAGEPIEATTSEVSSELAVPAFEAPHAVADVTEPASEPEAAPDAVELETPEPAPAEATFETDQIADLIAAANVEEATDALDEQADAPAEQPKVTSWRVIGRGFDAIDETSAGDEDAAPQLADIPDAETVERVSRYNFDELSRILSDRVSGPATPSVPEEAPPAVQAPEGALISLAGETFILNRLPLGIMVFRDQQVLFANRALTDLTGYNSIESLRAAGITAIFPAEEAGAAGPVTQLVRRDGTLAPVNARLQSISWHGRPALMLSASLAESRLGHEAAVKTFAELHAQTSEEGFLTADRSGVVNSVSLHGRILLGRTETELAGQPLAALIDPQDIGELQHFLERPARFAETARPAVVLRGLASGTQIVLFAEGQAGMVTGYLGTVRKLPSAPVPAPQRASEAFEDVEPSMLVRISRGVRRPLNSIIGFADLIHSSPEGQRQAEYARDIKTAGLEIATLVDELDDYARLREGRYDTQADDIELSALLDTCLMRVRGQAAAARVLVRSAVSERLPHITADRASLTQAVLNLLASAIDQTPAGGTVILSAQIEDDGAIIINVRDSGERRSDLGERFVVFRDGVGRDGEALMPVRSSVGLALTRSLLAVNALSLSVDPVAGVGTLFSLIVPAGLVKT